MNNKFVALWLLCFCTIWLIWCNSDITNDWDFEVQAEEESKKDVVKNNWTQSYPWYEVYDAGEATKAEIEWRSYTLFFYTPDCTDCLSLDRDIINNLESIPEDIVIYKVDMNDHPDLVNNYSIRWPNTVTIVNDKNNFSSIQWIATLSALVGSLWTATISIK